MTAFLYIPARDETLSRRRVDFTNIASLFGDTDEAPPRSRRHIGHAVLTVLILLIAMGDTLLIARPELLASLAEAGHATQHAPTSTAAV